jgi:hypothetical protein
MHPEARLSQADRDAIRDWVASTGASPERDDEGHGDRDRDHDNGE